MVWLNSADHEEGPALTRGVLEHELCSPDELRLDLIVDRCARGHGFVQHGGQLFLRWNVGAVPNRDFLCEGTPISFLQKADQEVFRADGVFERRHEHLVPEDRLVERRRVWDELHGVVGWHQVAAEVLLHDDGGDDFDEDDFDEDDDDDDDDGLTLCFQSV